MNALLVLTVGRTDVQLVVDGGRREFCEKQCAALHAGLEQRDGDWHVVAAPATKHSPEAQALPFGSFDLCTPKLDAVLDDLEAKDMRVAYALILETRRDPEAEPGDPRAAGLVLARRLRERLGESVEIHRTAFLQGRERLEDQGDPRDAVVRREVVARIDEAVHAATAKIADGQVVIATTGGFPRIAALAEEVVRLHVARGRSVELVEVADGRKADPPTVDRAVARQSVPEPAESYRARRHVLDLIEGGNLFGAWGAARHLDGDEVEMRWTCIVKWLSYFAASLPIPDECDIPVLRHPKKAIRAALRVEFALRAGDLPRAVHGTVAFFEAALWDHLGAHLTLHHDSKRRVYRCDPVPVKKLVRDAKSRSDDAKRPFEVVESDGDTWYRVFDGRVCAIRIAKHYLNNAALTNLGQALSDVWDLRNDVAHNEPTPARMDDACRQMVEAKLWSLEHRFLTQEVVRDVLAELCEKNPDRLCEDLIETVRTRLLAHRLSP